MLLQNYDRRVIGLLLTFEGLLRAKIIKRASPTHELWAIIAISQQHERLNSKLRLRGMIARRYYNIWSRLRDEYEYIHTRGLQCVACMRKRWNETFIDIYDFSGASTESMFELFRFVCFYFSKYLRNQLTFGAEISSWISRILFHRGIFILLFFAAALSFSLMLLGITSRRDPVAINLCN